MTNTIKVKNVYAKCYAKNKSIFEDSRLKQVLLIAQKIIPKSRERMLDIGCGDGSFTKVLGKNIQIKTMYGIEIAPEAAKKARKHGIKTKVFDVDNKRFPFPNDYFDFIFCGNLIEIVANPDHLLIEINRVLKKNGIVIITFPNIASWLSRIALLLGYLPYYSRISTQYDLGKMFRKISKGQSTGFIRLYNVSSFIKLAKFYGLTIKKIFGACEDSLPKPLKLIDSFLSKKPSLAFKIICVLTKT